LSKQVLKKTGGNFFDEDAVSANILVLGVVVKLVLISKDI
jgi:hypothetical protein